MKGIYCSSRGCKIPDEGEGFENTLELSPDLDGPFTQLHFPFSTLHLFDLLLDYTRQLRVPGCATAFQTSYRDLRLQRQDLPVRSFRLWVAHRKVLICAIS